MITDETVESTASAPQIGSSFSVKPSLKALGDGMSKYTLGCLVDSLIVQNVPSISETVPDHEQEAFKKSNFDDESAVGNVREASQIKTAAALATYESDSMSSSVMSIESCYSADDSVRSNDSIVSRTKTNTEALKCNKC